MRNCMMNAISLGCIAVGSFLLGSSFGLALSKDESDIFDENCVKLDDLPYDYTNDRLSTALIEGMNRAIDESKESYNRMVNAIYGPDSNLSMQERQLLRHEFNTTYGLIGIDIGNNHDEDDIYDKDMEDDQSWESTTQEITVGNDTIQVKQTSEGLEEVTIPYIIDEDDFFDTYKYPEFSQENLIYYAKDDVLTTERDEVIYNPEEIVGPDALTSFGVGTVDQDTVFVRNVKLGIEYEITRDNGSYQEIVLGYSDEDDERAYQNAKRYFENMEE